MTPDPSSADPIDALMTALVPPGSIDRRSVVREVIAELGLVRGLLVGLSLKFIRPAIPALIRIGARIGIELLLRRLGSQAAAPGDPLVIAAAASVREPANLHAATRAILAGED